LIRAKRKSEGKRLNKSKEGSERKDNDNDR
jgi:hypothetical protein